MQGLFLQLSRAGFLILLWLAVFAVVRALRSDLGNHSGIRAIPHVPSQKTFTSSGAPRFLFVTHGPLANTRITLGNHPVLIGRADDSTLVLSDDFASSHHASLTREGKQWYLEDLGSTNGTFLDQAKVSSPVVVPLNTPIRVGKTIFELRS